MRPRRPQTCASCTTVTIVVRGNCHGCGGGMYGEATEPAYCGSNTRPCKKRIIPRVETSLREPVHALIGSRSAPTTPSMVTVGPRKKIQSIPIMKDIITQHSSYRCAKVRAVVEGFHVHVSQMRYLFLLWKAERRWPSQSVEVCRGPSVLSQS